jgi:WD40 repeat protein
MLIKAFRLFVSSTFSDFAQERELLQSKVFPALDTHCAAKGYQFHAIDLRWGVNAEAQLDQRTAEICLGEVAAAKRYPPPNVLIMLGDRNGWVPLPFAIPRDEFQAAATWLTDRGQAEAVRDLRASYMLDDNYLVPPGLKVEAESMELISAYTLLSREDYIPKLASADAWKVIEDRLRRALQEAANQLFRDGRTGEAEHAKYFLSLTEQEIVEGLKNNAQYASERPDRGWPQSIAWIREHAGKGDPRVETLKSRIRRALPTGAVLSGRAVRNWRGQLKGAYLEDFAARIESRLREAIDNHIARVEAKEHSELLQERAQHHAFALERRSVFFGRDSNRSAIASYLAADSPHHPLVLFGASGLGKSALMAQAVADAEGSVEALPVVYRYVGASAASADIRALLVSIVEDLAAHGIATKPDQWEDDDYKFDEQIRTLLKSIDRHAVIFIDALDQLKKPRTGWLPNKLLRLKVVVSVLNDAAYEEDSGVYRALRQRFPFQAFLEIEPLTGTQGRDILLTLEASAQRSLRQSQRDYVLGRFETAGASPLYLKLAFEIARGWRSWNKVGQGRCVLAENTAALVGQLITELTSVHHHEPELVSRTLGYLAAAKDGLSAKEMTEVLSGDSGVMAAISTERHGVQTLSVERHGVRRPKLPDSVWVRLNRQLAPLLVEKRVDERPLMQFFHRQLADIARECHYALVKPALHSALADYFDAGAATPGKDPVASGRATYARRSLSELPYQLFHAGRRARLDEILMAPDWMQQKLAVAGIRALIDDYQYAHTQAHRLTGQTLELAAGVLARDPRQLIPQIIGRMRPSLSAEPTQAEAIKVLLRNARAQVSPPALVPRTKHLTQFSGMSPPGLELTRLSLPSSSTDLALYEDGKVILTGSECILVWDVASRKLAEILTPIDTWPSAHSGVTVVYGNRFSPKRLFPLSADRILSYEPVDYSQHNELSAILLWDPKDATEVARVVWGGRVTALLPLLDKRVAFAVGCQLCVWDPQLGKTEKLAPENKPILAISQPSDEYMISLTQDGTIRKWRLSTLKEEAPFHLEIGDIRFATMLDPQRVLLVLHEGRIAIWNANNQLDYVDCAEGNGITAAVRTADGRIVLGYSSGAVCIVDVSTGTEIGSLDGHTGSIVSLLSLPGNLLVSGGADQTLRLWNMSEHETRPAFRFRDSFRGLTSLSEDRFVCERLDGQLECRSFSQGTKIWGIQAHSGPIKALAPMAEKLLASYGSDNIVRVWDVKGREIKRFELGDIQLITMLPLPKLRIGYLSQGSVSLLDFGNGSKVKHLFSEHQFPHKGERDQNTELTACAVLPNDLIAFTTLHYPSEYYNVGSLYVWSQSVGCVSIFNRRLEWSNMQGRSLWGTDLRASADGRLAIVHGAWLELGRIAVGGKWSLLGTLHNGALIKDVAFLPHARIAIGDNANMVKIWDCERDCIIAQLTLDAPVACIAVLDKGRCLAIVDDLGRLHGVDFVQRAAGGWVERWRSPNRSKLHP